MEKKSRWVVIFNETGYLKALRMDIQNVAGKEVGKGLMWDLKHLDNLIKEVKLKQEMLELEGRPVPVDEEVLGYYKFFFERVDENGRKLEELRIDVGDGLDVNEELWNYMESFL